MSETWSQTQITNGGPSCLWLVKEGDRNSRKLGDRGQGTGGDRKWFQFNHGLETTWPKENERVRE